jgi:hypothetical protein
MLTTLWLRVYWLCKNYGDRRISEDGQWQLLNFHVLHGEPSCWQGQPLQDRFWASCQIGVSWPSRLKFRPWGWWKGEEEVKEEKRLPGKNKQETSLPSSQVMFLICKQWVHCKKSYTKGSKMSFFACIIFLRRKEVGLWSVICICVSPHLNF